jgi:hypothetical protein
VSPESFADIYGLAKNITWKIRPDEVLGWDMAVK